MIFLFQDKLTESDLITNILLALQKLLTFFLAKKNWHISDINVRNFNETLTNDVVSFEQPEPYRQKSMVSRINGNTGIFKPYTIIPPCTFASTVKPANLVTS